MPAWNSIRNFFVNTNNYLRDEDFHRDETAENIKMTELIYLIASHEDCCLKSKLLSNVDAAKENFEQISTTTSSRTSRSRSWPNSPTGR